MPQKINIVGDLGTTKLASDSYDIDNIYLTDEGWVYRHFKSTDGTRYWDEIIVAGEVPAGDSPQATNPPKLGTVAAPPYETGDGTKDWEYSEHQVTGIPGTYTNKVVAEGGGLGVGDGKDPVDGNIGDITGTAPQGTVTAGTAYTYTVAAEGAGTTFAWETSDASATLSATTGASITITWATAGAQTVTVTASLAGATDDGKQKVYNESVQAFVIGNVTNSGDASVEINNNTQVTATADGNADDLTYAWAITGGTGTPGDAAFGDPSVNSTPFQSTSEGTFELTCTVSSVKAGGAGGDGTGSKTTTLTVTATPPCHSVSLTSSGNVCPLGDTSKVRVVKTNMGQTTTLYWLDLNYATYVNAGDTIYINNRAYEVDSVEVTTCSTDNVVKIVIEEDVPSIMFDGNAVNISLCP